MKKVNVSVNEMIEAVKANGKEPWKVLGLGRTNWFRNLSKNGVNMTELRESSKVTQVNLGEGLAINVLSNSGDVEAMREYCEMLIQKTQAQHELLLAQKQNQLLLEQKEKAEAKYQSEKEEHQKDKELVLNKYLSATDIKDAIWKEYGKNIVVSKVVKRIPIEDNDILYKPFKNGNYVGQQQVYHPNVLDKIREIME